MSWPVNDPSEWLPGADDERSEVGVVGEDDTAHPMGTAKHVDVVVSDEPLLKDGTNIAPVLAERSHNVRVDVLVREQRELEGLHAGIFTSHTISFFKACAA